MHIVICTFKTLCTQGLKIYVGMNPIIKLKAWELKSYITIGSHYYYYYYYYYRCLETKTIIFGNVYLTYTNKGGMYPKKIKVT